MEKRHTSKIGYRILTLKNKSILKQLLLKISCFKIFEKNISEQDIDKVCEKFYITNYTINKDMSIDVKGDVSIANQNLKNFPLKFNNVSGNFICCKNELTSLQGSPVIIGGSANFSDNKLTSLKGGPKYIGKQVVFNQNQLTSLEHCPNYIGGNFNCSDNKITSLAFFPKILNGLFNCRKNPNDATGEFQEETVLNLMIEHNSLTILNKIQISDLNYQNLERQFTIHQIINNVN